MSLPWFADVLCQVLVKPILTFITTSQITTIDTTWKWGGEQQNAFEKLRELLTSSNLLIHFDPKLQIVLACDASNYGAVLAHRTYV